MQRPGAASALNIVAAKDGKDGKITIPTQVGAVP
jgi:hypothetical protein